MNRKCWSPLFLMALVGIVLNGCFGPLAKRLADEETYPILEEKQMQALGYERDMSIESDTDPLTQHLLEVAGTAGDVFTTDALRISLDDTLFLSIENSREYQTNKEDLYLSALDLTAARRDFSPIFTGLITSQFDRTTAPGPTGMAQPQRAGNINGSIGMSIIFATGTRVTLDLASRLTRFYGGPPNETASSALSADIVQPLLRGNPFLGGGGFNNTLENLRQSERDVIYDVRRFARYEKNFIVDRIDGYFRLLQTLDSIRNQEASLKSLEFSEEQSKALAEAGQLDTFQVNQAETQVLTARNALVNLQTRYTQQLDLFRFNMGIPSDLNIMPDENELDAMIDGGLEPIDVGLAEAIALALGRRLDYLNITEQVKDSERRLEISENNLLPDLDISGGVTIPDEGDNQPFDLNYDGREYQARLNAELPLDRKSERNNYRRALISLERSRRNKEETRDSITREVRARFQDLAEARESYEIQMRSLVVAEQRVDSTQMLLEAGRVQVRDVLDADTALLDARNQLTSALIDYSMTRLRFLVALEGLTIDDRGLWSETENGIVATAAESSSAQP